MRKVRSDSRLGKLPEHQREVLKRWFFEENLSHEEVSKRCWLDFSVRVSPTAVREYRQHLEVERRELRWQERLASIAAGSQQANAINAEFNRHQGAFSSATVKLLTQESFEALVQGGWDPENLVKFTKLAIESELKAKKLELDERRIALLEERAKQAEEAKQALGNEELSEEEKQQRLRQIFGMS